MKTDPLEFVQACLSKDIGNLRRVSEDTGIPYDTVLRIKNNENDPFYSKVKRLHAYYSCRSRKTR